MSVQYGMITEDVWGRPLVVAPFRARDFTCSWCGAVPGRMCVTRGGGKRKHSHAMRLELASVARTAKRTKGTT